MGASYPLEQIFEGWTIIGQIVVRLAILLISDVICIDILGSPYRTGFQQHRLLGFKVASKGLLGGDRVRCWIDGKFA